MRIRPPLAVPLAFLLLPCCLELEQTVELGADGSGTLSVHLGMSQKVLNQVRRTAPVLNPLGGGGDPLQIYEREAVEKELQAAGLELKEHTESRRGQRRIVDMKASFDGLETLQKSPLFGRSAEWEFAPGPKEGTIKLSLYPQGKQAWAEARRRALEMRDQEDPITRSFFERRKAQLQGLDVNLNLELPGKVYVWTRNLQKTGDQRVTARITADRIRTPVELVRWLAPRFEVVFDGRGCSWQLTE